MIQYPVFYFVHIAFLTDAIAYHFHLYSTFVIHCYTLIITHFYSPFVWACLDSNQIHDHIGGQEGYETLPAIPNMIRKYI